MNQIVLMGRLTRDVELRHTQSNTPVASFTLAVNRAYQKDKEQQADFINCVSWRGTAEFAEKWFGKGDMMAITGRLQMRDWQDNDGNKRTSAEVVVDNVHFCGGKKENASGGSTGTYSNNNSSNISFDNATNDDFAEPNLEDELPF